MEIFFKKTNLTQASRRSRFVAIFAITAALITAGYFTVVPFSQSTSALSLNNISATSGSTAGGEELILSGAGFLVGEKITQLVSGGGVSGLSIFALTDTGKVFAWGRNESGQLGAGDTEEKPMPTEITQNFAGEKVKQLVTAGDYTFALTNSNKVFAWGDNEFGQLGTGDTEDKFTPTEITQNFAGEKVKQLVTTSGVPFALTDSGKVFTWGGSDYIPTNITASFSGETITQIISNDDYSFFALTDSDKVFAWGDNNGGQLGTGDTEEKLTPTEITQNFAGETIKQLEAAGGSTFALTDTGKVFAWGG